MNILIITHEYPPVGGGGATACKYLSREFHNLGHTVTIVTSQFSDFPKESTQDGVRIFRIKSLRKKKDTSSFHEMLSFVVSAFVFTDQLCRRDSFDACLVFFGIPSGPIALHLKKKYKIPYTVRFGGGDIPGSQKRYGIIYRILNPINRSIWKNAHNLVANSESLRERALSFDNTNDIRIISNGVDSERYTRKIPYNCGKEIRLLFVSRLIEGKGLQYVIPYMKLINERSKRRVTLTIVGDGPFRNALEGMVGEDNKEYVSFAGRRENEDLLNLYENANIFILPSLSEGMPNVVLEAMSMELPIIMTDCGGSKELISGNGCVVGIDKFVDTVIEMCRNDERLSEYSRKSRERVIEYFSWKEKAVEYLRLIDE